RPRFQSIVARRIEDRDQADHAGIALVPFPWEALERAALAGDRFKVGADVLDRRNAGAEQYLVRRIPLGKVLDRLAPGRLLVLRQQVLDLRPVAMRSERGRERMVDGCRIDADGLDALAHQPLRRALREPWRVAEILLAVRIAAMPAGVDQ